MNTEMMVTLYGAGTVGYMTWAAVNGYPTRTAQAFQAARRVNLSPGANKALTVVLGAAIQAVCGAAWPVATPVAQWKTRRPAASDTTA